MDFAQLPSILASWFGGAFGAHPTWDMLLVILFAGLVVVITFWPRAALTTILLSLYASIATLTLSSLGDWLPTILGGASNVWAAMMSLVLVWAVLFSFVHYGLARILSKDRGAVSSNAFIAVGIIGLATVFTLTSLPQEVLEGFSPLTRGLFAGSFSTAMWSILPLILLAGTRE